MSLVSDTHANACREMRKFNMDNFPIQKEMTRDDYVIICGDFGFVWGKEETKEEKNWLDWLDSRNFTTLFIDGNHENFDRLYSFPVEEWHGGNVHKIRPNVIHLMRGQIFEINGKTFAAMGGAPSHDIEDGIFDPADYADRQDMFNEIGRLERRRGGWRFARYRIKGESWWPQEEPSAVEWCEWWKNLEDCDFKVDYVLTHEAPSSIVSLISTYKPTGMSKVLEKDRWKLEFKHWFSGHYHQDRMINDKHTVVYNNMIRIM